VPQLRTWQPTLRDPQSCRCLPRRRQGSLGRTAGAAVHRWSAHHTVAVTAANSWTIYRWGWQFTGSEALDEAYMPFVGAFRAAWDDAMVARWSANPRGTWLCSTFAVFPK
jgi:hypothetical protein